MKNPKSKIKILSNIVNPIDNHLIQLFNTLAMIDFFIAFSSTYSQVLMILTYYVTVTPNWKLTWRYGYIIANSKMFYLLLFFITKTIFFCCLLECDDYYFECRRFFFEIDIEHSLHGMKFYARPWWQLKLVSFLSVAFKILLFNQFRYLEC